MFDAIGRTDYRTFCFFLKVTSFLLLVMNLPGDRAKWVGLDRAPLKTTLVKLLPQHESSRRESFPGVDGLPKASLDQISKSQVCGKDSNSAIVNDLQFDRLNLSILTESHPVHPFPEAPIATRKERLVSWVANDSLKAIVLNPDGTPAQECQIDYRKGPTNNCWLDLNESKPEPPLESVNCNSDARGEFILPAQELFAFYIARNEQGIRQGLVTDLYRERKIQLTEWGSAKVLDARDEGDRRIETIRYRQEVMAGTWKLGSILEMSTSNFEDAFVHFEKVPPGTVRFSNWRANRSNVFVRGSVDTAIFPGKTTSIRLFGRGVIWGMVEAQKEVLLAGLDAILESQNDPRTVYYQFAAPVGLDGDFRLEGIPEGQYRLRFAKTLNHFANAAIEIRTVQDISLSQDQEIDVGTIRLVTKPSSIPMWNDDLPNVDLRYENIKQTEEKANPKFAAVGSPSSTTPYQLPGELPVYFLDSRGSILSKHDESWSNSDSSHGPHLLWSEDRQELFIANGQDTLIYDRSGNLKGRIRLTDRQDFRWCMGSTNKILAGVFSKTGGSLLVLFDSDFREIGRTPFKTSRVGKKIAAFSSKDGAFWIACGDVLRFSVEGNEVARVPIENANHFDELQKFGFSRGSAGAFGLIPRSRAGGCWALESENLVSPESENRIWKIDSSAKVDKIISLGSLLPSSIAEFGDRILVLGMSSKFFTYELSAIEKWLYLFDGNGVLLQRSSVPATSVAFTVDKESVWFPVQNGIMRVEVTSDHQLVQHEIIPTPNFTQVVVLD